MRPIEQHEGFEMEVLHFLNGKRLLHTLVFGGGTMLRLCFDMNRYSVDMDFYFKRKPHDSSYFQKLTGELSTKYTITDSHEKFNTFLVEFAHVRYPRRLKIEINRKVFYPTFRQAIAFSPHSTNQVLVNVIPLDQMLANKTKALFDRKEIRDAFDIDFLMKRGIPFPQNHDTKRQLLAIIRSFSQREFDVKLGSLLTPDIRDYYRKHRFEDLEGRLEERE